MRHAGDSRGLNTSTRTSARGAPPAAIAAKRAPSWMAVRDPWALQCRESRPLGLRGRGGGRVAGTAGQGRGGVDDPGLGKDHRRKRKSKL